MTQQTAVEMTVGGLLMDPNNQAPVVVLKDETGDIVLPIWIGIAEATSIASALKHVTLARPLTHDLIKTLLDELGCVVDRIVITDLKEATYFAELVLIHGDKALIVDTRPSDAIAIALRYNAPIFVAQEVLTKAKGTIKGFQAPQLDSPKKGETEGAQAAGDETQEVEEAPLEDFKNFDKEKWSEILDGLDPNDFKYKM